MPRSPGNTIGLIGLVVALMGLAVTIFAPLVLEAQRPPLELSDVLADTALKIKERVTNQTPPAAPPQTNWRMLAIISASAIGFIGAVLGVIAWIRHENLRLSKAAVVVGVTAIAFHHKLAAVAIFIVLYLIASWLD